MPYSRHKAEMFALRKLAASANFILEFIGRWTSQGIQPSDTCQRCPDTFVSAMSWYRTWYRAGAKTHPHLHGHWHRSRKPPLAQARARVPKTRT